MSDEPTLFERPYFAHVIAFYSQPEEHPTHDEIRALLYSKRAQLTSQELPPPKPTKPYRSSHEPDGGGLALGLAMGIGLGGMFHSW